LAVVNISLDLLTVEQGGRKSWLSAIDQAYLLQAALRAKGGATAETAQISPNSISLAPIAAAPLMVNLKLVFVAYTVIRLLGAGS
jgi:hypothetical protein